MNKRIKNKKYKQMAIRRVTAKVREFNHRKSCDPLTGRDKRMIKWLVSNDIKRQIAWGYLRGRKGNDTKGILNYVKGGSDQLWQ